MAWSHKARMTGATRPWLSSSSRTKKATLFSVVCGHLESHWYPCDLFLLATVGLWIWSCWKQNGNWLSRQGLFFHLQQSVWFQYEQSSHWAQEYSIQSYELLLLNSNCLVSDCISWKYPVAGASQSSWGWFLDFWQMLEGRSMKGTKNIRKHSNGRNPSTKSLPFFQSSGHEALSFPQILASTCICQGKLTDKKSEIRRSIFNIPQFSWSSARFWFPKLTKEMSKQVQPNLQDVLEGNLSQVWSILNTHAEFPGCSSVFNTWVKYSYYIYRPQTRSTSQCPSRSPTALPNCQVFVLLVFDSGCIQYHKV